MDRERGQRGGSRGQGGAWRDLLHENTPAKIVFEICDPTHNSVHWMYIIVHWLNEWKS